MKRFLQFLIFFVPLICSIASAEIYKVKPSSIIGFEIKKMMLLGIDGAFKSFDGEVEIKDKKLINLYGEVEIASIDTDNTKRDAHLKESDFFDASNFPKGSLRLKELNNDALIAILTLKGISKEVEFKYTLDVSDESAFLKLDAEVSRRDFQIGTDTGGFLAADSVRIHIGLDLSK